jgi:Leucine rich repeat
MSFSRLRFTIQRMMLMVALLAALFGVFYAYFIGPIHVETGAVSLVEHRGGHVSRVDNHPAWLKRILQGQDQKRVVIVHLEGANISDSDILYLKEFPKLGGLYLNRTPITNAALTTIEEMAELQDLDLSGTKITALQLTGLSKLQELKLSGTPVESMRLIRLGDLRVLEMSGTKIDDADADDFIGFQKLHTLKLQETGITDAGLARLGRLPQLRSVWIKGTRITQDGINNLKQVRPDITVFPW